MNLMLKENIKHNGSLFDLVLRREAESIARAARGSCVTIPGPAHWAGSRGDVASGIKFLHVSFSETDTVDG